MSDMAFRMDGPSRTETPARPAGTEGRVPAGPRLTTTVPREFVHRAAVAEVLLTGWHRTDEARFAVTAQWPRLHSFFSPVQGRHDPLLAAETIRQVGSLLAHTEFGTPLGHHFLMRDLSLTVEPRHLAIGEVPAGLELDVTCSRIRRRGAELAGLRYEAVVHRDGQTVATGGASFDCVAPAVYRRLRGERAVSSGVRRPPLGTPVPPGSVGRSTPLDVVLSPTGDAQVWQLRADPGHPILFDHPVDHIPGMVLLEAARQAANSLMRAGHCVLTSFSAEFPRFAELDLPCRIEARNMPGDFAGLPSVLVTGHQEDEEVFRCVVSAPLSDS
ncbi:ScbA/BarX family gamma-butyrolactone biosynthesis protein [Streptomyces sp. AK02-01A]|uniref:ScbA/BarX family gamma-butyrolactone biosynthesis protein n=1 Tax=Streptomyces sp. AK02-01A TaxID=3028648 RepID=UPI0029AAD330|nr:ScbA/BarX family gamma-butyrolactone biosynthesis protein [Streptomyces sp. AK02-01A]MDX3850028.1 ScbA/BarX family gamma-butyrolactone biosynthesis protein [Streptomyces sp. AK02-01A]